MFLLLPDQQGCLQRRFPSGQFSFPTSPLPRRTLHHYRHRSVCWGGGSADRLSLQRGPRIAATHMSSPSSVTGPPGIELSCRAQGASACKGCLHSRTPARMPCASSFPFQTVDPCSPQGHGVPPSDSRKLGTGLAAETRRSIFAWWKTCRRNTTCCCLAEVTTRAPRPCFTLPLLVPRLGP